MKKYFGDYAFLKKLVLIALPIGMQSVINLVVNLIDTIMVGKLGDIALSAVNLSSQFPFLYMMLFMGLSNGGMIIASQAWGNGKPETVRAMLAFILRMALFINIVFFLISFLFPSEVISIYTNEREIIGTGAGYLRILSLTLLFQSFSQIIVTLLRCAGINRLGFTSSTAACIANVFFNWVFIFGHFGFPAMGVAGAALGTVIARLVECLIVSVYLFTNKVLPFGMKDMTLSLSPEVKKDFKKVTAPAVISEVTQNLNVSAAAMITGRVSPYYIAANTIVHNIWTISSLFMFGIATGASVMIGHEIGAGDEKKADEYAHYFIHLGVVIGLAGAVLIHVIAPIITGFFNVSEETIRTAGELKNAASVVIFFLAMQVILTKGILRGGGQSAAVTKVDLLSCWLVNIPVGFLAALVLHMNPFWIYLSLRIDYIIKTVWGLSRIRKGGWMIHMNVQ